MVSLKEISQAIASALRGTVNNDEQEALDLIDRYLDQQRSQSNAHPFSDHGSVDKLSADLLHILKEEILSDPTVSMVSMQPSTIKVQAKHRLLLVFVHQLLPVFGVNRIMNDWWTTALKPVLQNSHYPKASQDVCINIVSDALIIEDQSTESSINNKFTNSVIKEYLQWSNKQKQNQQDAILAVDYASEVDDTNRMKLQHSAILDQEQDEWSRNLSAILIGFGTARTKSFFLLVQQYFVQSQYRLQAVHLMSAFILHKRTHIHDILKTPLFDSMLKSLMFDNSTTLIAISVTNLIMLLPRICAYLSPYLPQLFYIFARAVCWDQLRDFRQKSGSTQDATLASREATSKIVKLHDWDLLDYTFSKLSAPPSNPRTGSFFTSLYGLYPCNFTSFLHDPYAYFTKYSFELPEQFDEDTFRDRIIPQVNRHMLHPNLVVMDAATELVDLSRWMKLEPPDVMAQIMSLDLTNAASRVAFSEGNSSNAQIKTKLFEQQVQAEAAQRHFKPSDHLSPNLSKEEEPEVPQTPSAPDKKRLKAVSIANVLNVHRALKSGSEVVVGDDVWESGLEKFPTSQDAIPNPNDISLSEGAPTPAPNIMMAEQESSSSSEQNMLIAALKREVLLLRNEMNFEMFLKQQHLQHIGRLHREHVMDTSVEAERQQLYNTTRMLQQQLQRTTEALEKLKAENEASKKKHIKWEDEQSDKLRDYREQRKKWQSDMAKAREHISEIEAILKVQDGQLEDARKRVFDLESELKVLRPTLVTIQEYETKVDQLTKQMTLWEQDTATIQEQKSYIEKLFSQWKATENILVSYRESEKRAKYDSKFVILLFSVDCCLQANSNNVYPKLHSKLQFQYNEMEAALNNLEIAQKKDIPGKSAKDTTSSESEFQRLKARLELLRERNEALELEKLELQAQLEQKPTSLFVTLYLLSPLPGCMATEKTVEKFVEDSNVSNVLSSSVVGASYLILLQLASRMLTFALHQIVMRYTSAETLGIASVKLELLLSTILFLSREGFRCALLRGGSSTTTQMKKENKSRHKGNVIDVTSPEGEAQKVINLAYLPTAIGLVTTLTACIYYLSTIDDATAAKYPFYRTSIIIYGVSAYCELLIEPLYIMALNNLYFKLRVSAEGVATLLRCFLTFGLTVLGANGSETNRYGVLAFALAQLAFVLALVVGYIGFFANKVRNGEIDGKCMIPRKLIDSKDGRTFWFDKTLLDLSLTLTKQSMLKHVLTEGDKMLVSALSSDRDQGVYALVVNYGSLIARILFGPLEETSRTLFSKLLSDVGDKELTKSQSHALEISARILNTIFKLQMLLGLIFACFATNYTATLIDLLVGSAWSKETNAPTVLAFYCVYVPVMGINGISEAFVQAVASEQQLARLSRYMLIFSLIFVCSGVVFMHFMQLGAIGLVLANIVNLTSRIIYSWIFIQHYFTSKRGPAVAKISQIITLRNWLPSKMVLLVFASGWAITRMSEEIIGWSTLREKVVHVAIGGVAALVAIGTIWWKEKSFIRELRSIARSQKQD